MKRVDKWRRRLFRKRKDESLEMTKLAFQGAKGVEIAAETYGQPSAPPVLLLPAIGQTKEMWRSAGEALAEAGRYAICIDLRGHGDSGRALDGCYDLAAYAADARTILGQLSARATVVGVGASGAAAILAVGQSASPLVSALVLIGATAWVEAEVAARIVEAMALRSGSFPDAASALAAVASAYPLEPMPTAADKLLSAFEVGPDGSYSWRCDHRVLHGIDLESDSARLEMACAKITVPTALIRG